MAKEGVLPRLGEMFGPGGNRQLDTMELGECYSTRVESLRAAVRHYDREVAMLERRIHQRLKHDRGYLAIQAIPGVGRTIAGIFVAEIGDVSRFANAEALTSWAGLAPRHRESDTKVVRGPITKAGSKLVRWAAIEAVSGRRGGTKLRADFDAIAGRRGKYKARAAVARKLLTLVYYGLRDGEIRCLTDEAA
jgi:transposase